MLLGHPNFYRRFGFSAKLAEPVSSSFGSGEASRYFANEGPRTIVMIDEPGVGVLSKMEIELLQDGSNEFAQADDYELSLLTHEFREWRENFVPRTSTPIPLEAIIDAVGRGNDKDSIIQDLCDDAAIDRFFANTRQYD